VYSFFEHIGPARRERFETLPAIHAGMDVLKELRSTVH
jgi:hypothetical protein